MICQLHLRNDPPEINKQELYCFWNIVLDKGCQSVDLWYCDVGTPCPHSLKHPNGLHYKCSPPLTPHYVKVVCVAYMIVV
jgi:hypothetical protein